MATPLMDEVAYWIEASSSDNELANYLINVAGRYRPEDFMHIVPKSTQIVLMNISKSPPQSVDDLGFIQSSMYPSSFFDGLSEDEIEKKLEDDKRRTAQVILDGLWALNGYFKMSRSHDN